MRIIIDQSAPAPVRWMDRAAELAAVGPAHGPNPRVGCVLVKDGAVVGEGYHRGAGTPHAEPAAIADAHARGLDPAGATAYVTLEPCAHTGRTGPCTLALQQAGVSAVNFAVSDPNPSAQGGAHVLAAAGIPAQLTPHVGALRLNERWLAAVTRGRPWVIVKYAATLDGRTAAGDGTSFWITGDEAREHAHQVRAQVDAIIVGTETVVVDNPTLSARPGGADSAHQPLRVVVGLRDTAVAKDGAPAKVWRDDNAVALHTHDPVAVLSALNDREVRTAVVEGGATLTSAFVAAGCVDEFHIYLAPALLGSGPSAVQDVGMDTMSQALRLQDVTYAQLGTDILVSARFPTKG